MGAAFPGRSSGFLPKISRARNAGPRPPHRPLPTVTTLTYGRDMYWLSRPPYWRWFAAVLIVAIALYLDFTGPPTEPYPFVAQATAAGEELEIEWRPIPTGLLPAHETPPANAWRALDAGVPLVPGMAGEAPVVPEGWWALEVDLPAAAAVGEAVLVAIRDPQLEVAGLVVAPPGTGSFGSGVPGLIAVPGDQAAAVANALAAQRATVLVQP